MKAGVVHLSVLELMVGSAAFSAKLRRDGCEAQAFDFPEDRHERNSPVIDLDLTLLLAWLVLLRVALHQLRGWLRPS